MIEYFNQHFHEILGARLYMNAVRTWILASGVFLVLYFSVRILRRFLIRRFGKTGRLANTRMGDLALQLLRKTKRYFVLVWSFYGGFHILHLPARADNFLDHLVLIATLLQMGTWGVTVIDFWVEHYLREKAKEDLASTTTMGLVGFVGKAVLYVTLILFGLNNVGINITTLVAGLGVGGVAVALAVQNILGDLFASLTIVLDKPFVIGDSIAVGEYSGTIERIGLKTTRIRSLSGEQLVFPNADLLQSRIRNQRRMTERRVVLGLGIDYATSFDSVQKIVPLVRQIIEKQNKLRFESGHFKELGKYALHFEFVYWVTEAAVPLHIESQQNINLEIFRRFSEEKIAFAYPTQTLYVHSQDR